MNARSVLSLSWMLVASTALTLLLGELAIRQLLPQELSVWSLTPEGLIVHRPNDGVWSPRYGRELRTNSMGMRDVEHPVAKPADRYRVLLLGDSFTEGFQVDEHEMLARQLEQALAPRVGRDVEVLNAGVSGWGTDHALFYVMQNARDLQPDLILYTLTLYTDIGDNLGMQFHFDDGGTLRERPLETVGPLDVVEASIKETLAARSQLFQFVRSGLRQGDDAAAADQLESRFVELFLLDEPERLTFGRAFTSRLFAKASELSDQLGVPSVVVVIPMAMQLSDREYAEFVAANRLDPESASLDWPQASIEAGIATETDGRLPIIDLLEPFRAAAQGDSQNLYSKVDGHWNAAGQAIAAEVLAADLEALGVLSRPDAR